METTSSSSFLARNEFLIRRLFSLCGLVPVGAYMVVHLITNASLLDSPATFQKAVYQIHGLGKALPIIEWGFIFLPIMFHAILGVVIIRGGLPNSGTYNYGSNIRYTLQRATGMIAFAFIFLHVFHMHGWLHFDAWLTAVEGLGGAKFRPYNAGSSVVAALKGQLAWTALYVIGVLSCVFHLSNGIWSAGIRWGVWVSPAAMRRATVACTIFGVGLGLVAVSAIGAPWATKVKDAVTIEDAMFQSRTSSHEVDAIEATKKKKRWKDEEKAQALMLDEDESKVAKPSSDKDSSKSKPADKPAS